MTAKEKRNRKAAIKIGVLLFGGVCACWAVIFYVIVSKGCGDGVVLTPPRPYTISASDTQVAFPGGPPITGPVATITAEDISRASEPEVDTEDICDHNMNDVDTEAIVEENMARDDEDRIVGVEAVVGQEFPSGRRVIEGYKPVYEGKKSGGCFILNWFVPKGD